MKDEASRITGGLHGVVQPRAFDNIYSARKAAIHKQTLTVAGGWLAEEEAIVVFQTGRQSAGSSQRETVRRPGPFVKGSKK